MNIAALVAANTSPTRSIDPAKIKARSPVLKIRSSILVNLQARILEKQEAVQERKAKKKVPFPASPAPC